MNKALIIIPAYNEEASIGNVIGQIKNALPQFDVLVVNDGSLDSTSEAAKSSGAMVLDLPCNLGIGNSIQTGLLFAARRGYNFVVRLDADGQHRPEDVKSLIKPILSGEADMAVGSRFLSSEGGFKSTFTRRVGIKFFSVLTSLIIRKRVTDPTSGFQAMNIKTVGLFAKEYPPDYPEIEALVLADKAGIVIKEVPVKMLARKGGQSSINFVKSMYYVLEVFTSLIVSIFRKL
ncbi:MAG: glycosyltransferase family 2 protein [Candidatus Brocadiales bacterium]|nr:glycosyltransferase family 2 protein [Candidatus Brocadiales bacterium]